MATMSSPERSHDSHPLGSALLGYFRDGSFPDEDVSAAQVEGSALPGALEVLKSAKHELETEIRTLSREAAPDVESWMIHAKCLQNDIDKSRRLASEIVRQAEAEEQRMEVLRDAEIYVEFLIKEEAFNHQLEEALQLIQQTKDCMDQAEQLVNEGRMIEGLKSLEEVSSMIEQIPIDRSVKLMRILDTRVSDLREVIHEHFRNHWKRLVDVDYEESCLTIHKRLENWPTGLDQTITGLKAGSELDKVAQQLWDDLDNLVFRPRIGIQARTPSKIEIGENKLRVIPEGEPDTTINSLLLDIESIIHFLADDLPPDLVQSFSPIMMPNLFSDIRIVWLDAAIPASLDHMDGYQEVLAQIADFAATLELMQWPGAEYFRDWVASAPRKWLSKRRETSLDWVRNELALGIGSPKPAEHTEQRMVSSDDSMHISTAGNATVDDWDNGWNSEEEKEEATSVLSEAPKHETTSSKNEDPDGADAWSWGDDDAPEIESDSPTAETPAPKVQQPASRQQSNSKVRQVTLTEKFWRSSMPSAVFNIITQIYEDGAKLMQKENESSPVAPAAGGLSNIPTLVLALYRAVSPFFYENDPIGLMYAYNDSVWLCDNLKEFIASWKQRSDLTPRASAMLKLDPEVKALESFGRRAYGKEMDTQRLVLKDILGGSQNFLQQDDMEASTDAAISHIHEISKQWKKILPPSVWRSAVGSLINTISSKIINDVFDLTDMAIDEAESTAKLISKITTLDSLFASEEMTPLNRNEIDNQPAPLMAEYADKWLELQFLSEVLQSNLNEIKWLWFESDLSMHFTKEEVVDLIRLSFENNTNARQAIKEIKEKPYPDRGQLR